MRLVYLLALVCLLAGCAMQPLTPEQEAENNRQMLEASRTLQGLNQPQHKSCTVVDMGGGIYSQSCP